MKRLSESAEHTLLLVDDDPTLRLLVAAGLQQHGYRVIQAEQGQQALAQLKTHPADLVLLDVMMPGISGFEVLRTLRALPGHEHLPVLMLTGADDVASVNEAFEAGATDFITKPINLPLLIQRVRYALRGAQRETMLRQLYLQQQTARRLARLGFWQLDVTTQRICWSEDAAELLGWHEPLPATVDDFVQQVVATDQARLKRLLSLTVQHHEGFNTEVTLGQGHQERTLRLQGTIPPQDTVMIGAFQDVTALRAFEDQAFYLTGHDELTDLPNQRLFSRLLTEQIQRLSATQSPFALLVFDIHRLHRINEGFGIKAGDEILRTFAQRLQQLAPPNTLLCRLEADTFALTLPMETGDAVNEALLAHCAEALERPYGIGSREVFVDFSVGGCRYPQDAQQAEALMQLAKRAQRHARQKNGLKLSFHHQIDLESSTQGIIMETDLRRALERDEFFLVFQPQQDISTGQIVGAEALLRWRHAKQGVISPDRFIPLLEESGKIQAVGDWVIQAACAQTAYWKAQGMALRMGINLSALQFEQPDLPAMIERHVAQYGLPAQHIELEITESIAMSNPQATLLTLQKLKSVGFQIAIDDFGTGYSSMEYLLRFPLDKLKIDRSFIRNITDEARSRSIIRALNVLGNGLNLKIIAEGVETQRQRDYLDALGIQEIQGFLLAKPLPAHEFEAFFQQHTAKQAQRCPASDA